VGNEGKENEKDNISPSNALQYLGGFYFPLLPPSSPFVLAPPFPLINQKITQR